MDSQQADGMPVSPAPEGSSSPFSPCHPPSLCLLLFLQKHSLSGLISSICCNHEQIQITTFPCGGHMSLLRTEVALSLPHRGEQGTQGEKLKNGRGLYGILGRPWVLSLSAGPAAWPSVWWPQPSSMQLPAAPPLSAPSSPRRWSLTVPF